LYSFFTSPLLAYWPTGFPDFHELFLKRQMLSYRFSKDLCATPGNLLTNRNREILRAVLISFQGIQKLLVLRG
jgi:hypothetical protein